MKPRKQGSHQHVSEEACRSHCPCNMRAPAQIDHSKQGLYCTLHALHYCGLLSLKDRSVLLVRLQVGQGPAAAPGSDEL